MTATLAGVLGLSGGAAVVGQEATPIGPNVCIAPTTTASIAATPVDDAAMATPIGEEAAGGAAVEDQAVIAEATAAIENLYTCFNEGQGEAYAALYTDEGRTAAYGDIDPTELAAQVQALSTVVQAGEVEVIEVVDLGDGSLGIEYQVMIGQQVMHHMDTLVSQNIEAWLVDDRQMLSPETELDIATAGINVSAEDGAVTIEVSPSPIMNQPALRLQVNNNAGSALQMVLLEGGDAAAMTEVDLANLPEGATFVGRAMVEEGERLDTLFEELAEGEYVIVVETAEGDMGTFDLTIDPPFDPNA
jgi:hypothetical protein